jgi:hypothetical protein
VRGVGVRADSYSVPACRNKISPAASASAMARMLPGSLSTTAKTR